ncbi:hypothetical protein ACOME3_003633 [Neoechinorhynchus agilis]
MVRRIVLEFAGGADSLFDFDSRTNDMDAPCRVFEKHPGHRCFELDVPDEVHQMRILNVARLNRRLLSTEIAQHPFKQELPPSIPYPSIYVHRGQSKRIPAKYLYAGGLAYSFIILYGLRQNHYIIEEVKREELEKNEGRIGNILSEQDRLFLKHLRQSRDEENRIMKDVPGWKTGTWKGEPVYKTKDYMENPHSDYVMPHCGSTQSERIAQYWYTYR